MNIEKQRKTIWVIAAIVGIIYYGPSVIVAVYRLMHPQPNVHRPAPGPKPQALPPKPPSHAPLLAETPATPAATPPPPSPSGVHYPPELTRLTGFWRGRVALSGRGVCEMHFELRAKADTDKFTGYSTLTCNGAGPLVARPNAKTITLNRNDPEAAIMTGAQEDGSLKFQVDQVVGTDSSGCAPTSFTMTPFGASRVAAEWHEATCAGGHMLMAKTPK